jgi:hypothetical protein
MSSYLICMCGATDCPSCGPAQGFARCEVCGLWECLDPEACQRTMDACNRHYQAMATRPHCVECGMTKEDIECETRRHGFVDPMCCDMGEFYDAH